MNALTNIVRNTFNFVSAHPDVATVVSLAMVSAYLIGWGQGLVDGSRN